jgi:hypothetical protein
MNIRLDISISRLSGIIFGLILFFFMFVSLGYAQSPCEGQRGAAFGLCQAHEVSGCGEGGDATACDNIAEMYEEIIGEPIPETCPCGVGLEQISWATADTIKGGSCSKIGVYTENRIRFDGEAISFELIQTSDTEFTCEAIAPDLLAQKFTATEGEARGCLPFFTIQEDATTCMFP